MLYKIKNGDKSVCRALILFDFVPEAFLGYVNWVVYPWKYPQNYNMSHPLNREFQQEFTEDLPQINQVYQTPTKSLSKYFFNLPNIYWQFTKNVWTKIFSYFYYVHSQKCLATVN